MKIINSENNCIIADDCRVANTFITRFLGLMGRSALPNGLGLQIIPCNSIHMMFMKFPLDIVFLDRDNTVVYIIEAIQPWKLSKIIKTAHSVLELPVGTIRASDIYLGNKLQFIYPQATL